MKERRTLVGGIGPLDRSAEKEFVFGGKAGTTPADGTPVPPRREPTASQQASTANRMPLSTRIRSDFGTALKRASLERQLSGTTPNTLQDILEEALEPWLRDNGYLPN
ncbi:MAG: hypothetical protein ABGY75_05785 [Gemmataceae bacterium]